MIVKETIIPIYNHRLTLIHSNDYDSFSEWFEVNCKKDVKKLEFHSVDDIYAAVVGGTRFEKDLEKTCSYVILNTKNKYNDFSVGVIAHEALHVVDNVFKHIGHEHDADNAEPTTYLLEYVTDEIINFLKDNKIKF